MGVGAQGPQLRPYVPEIAASWLAASPDVRYRGVEGSLAFVDISGFTTLARRLTRQGAVGSEELSDILDATFTALLAHARREAGDLVKWGGDAVLLLFTGDDHATRAVRAAVDMRSELRTVGRTRSSAGAVSLRMSVGIHSGRSTSSWSATRNPPRAGHQRPGREPVRGDGGAGHRRAGHGERGDGRAPRPRPGGRARRGRAPDPEATTGRAAVRRPRTAAGGLDVAGLLSPPLRAHLLAAAGASEHRAVGVAFVEFSGTDELIGTDGPEALADALDAVVRNAQDACARHGATFLESDINRNGGKLMLVAGAPGGGRDVEDRILGVARLVVDRAGALPLRAGVNRGVSSAATSGRPFRRTYSLKGDAINLAARVMGKTPGRRVLRRPRR